MALPPLNVLGLCAGAGGLELGIRLAVPQARAICYVEREAAAAASLVASMEAGWFHPAPVWSDLLTFDARPWRGLVHILASGDPCQDNSVAGKRAGSGGQRFLAPEVVRIADECRPDLIFRENVPGNAGEQLSAICPPLERLGYRVAAGIFSSAETGNTMRRERLFILACTMRPGRQQVTGSAFGDEGTNEGWPTPDHNQPSSDHADLARAKSQRPREARPDSERSAERYRRPSGELEQPESIPPAVIPGPTDSRWIDVLDRWPELQPALSQEEAESHLRRGVDAMANRVERLRATGNGVDPVAAAYAYLRLSARLAEACGSGGVVLMERAAWPPSPG